MSKNIKGITIEIEGKTTGLEQALSSVNKEATKTQTELNAINKSLKFNPGNAELAAQKQKLLSQQVATTSEKLKQLKDAEQQVRQQVQNGNIGEDKYRAFQREVIETESKLKTYTRQLESVGKEQEEFGRNTKRLETYFKATKTTVDDYESTIGSKLTNSIKNGTASSKDLSQALDKIAKESLGSKEGIESLKRALDKIDDGNSIDNVVKELEELKKTSSDTDTAISDIGKGVKSGNTLQAMEHLASAGSKVIEFGGKAQDAFRTVDEGLDIITTKTGKSADKFKQQFDNIYSSMAVDSTADVGSALGEINTQLDLTEDKLESAARQALMFANINGTDVSQSIVSAKSALEAYGLSNNEFENILDSVTATSQRTGVGVDNLMTSAINGAPQIKALGLTFAEGVEVLGQFEKAGVDGDAALSSLSKASVIYAKDGLTLKQGLESTIDKIKNATNETDALTEASKIFGTKGASRMVDAIKRGTLSFDDLSKAAKNSQGTVSETYAETVDDIDAQQIAMQNMNMALAEFGSEISSALKPVLDAVVPLIKDLTTWFKDLPEPVKSTIVVIGGLLAGLTTLMPLISSLTIAGPAIMAGITSIVGLLAPFAGIIAGIVAAVAAAILIFQNWDSIIAFLGATWQWLQSIAGEIWNNIASTVTGFIDGGISKFEEFLNFINGVWESVTTTAQNVWTSIQETVSTAIKAAQDAVGSAIDAIIGFLDFEWKWPKIPLPHFTFSGSLNPLDWGDASKRPNVGVEWYAKGGILTRPTVFGVNGNNLMVGGEAGKEAVLPLNRDTLSGIGAGIASTMGNQQEAYFAEMIDLLQQIVLKDNATYLDGKIISREISPELDYYNQLVESRNRRMKGVR